MGMYGATCVKTPILKKNLKNIIPVPDLARRGPGLRLGPPGPVPLLRARSRGGRRRVRRGRRGQGGAVAAGRGPAAGGCLKPRRRQGQGGPGQGGQERGSQVRSFYIIFK